MLIASVSTSSLAGQVVWGPQWPLWKSMEDYSDTAQVYCQELLSFPVLGRNGPGFQAGVHTGLLE